MQVAHRAEIESSMSVLESQTLPVDADVVFVSLESGATRAGSEAVWNVAAEARSGAEIVIYGDMSDLSRIHSSIPRDLRYHLCVSVRSQVRAGDGDLLPSAHRALLFYGKHAETLIHAKVRIAYEYCPACGKTTKDYGGRKHLYHEYGTLMSDVWKDLCVPPDDLFPREIVERVRDMMSVNGRRTMVLMSVLSGGQEIAAPAVASLPTNDLLPLHVGFSVDYVHHSSLVQGDALEVLESVPDECVDLAFADPPYNLAKGYADCRDRLDLQDYFAWCDRWLSEYLRILKPGGILGVLNIPLWAMRHASFLDRRATLLNWVVWEAMSMPVRFIMPSNYSLLLYSKGERPHVASADVFWPGESDLLLSVTNGYCRRASCVRKRHDASCCSPVTDLWTDIDRLKHNSLRWDHPCQLPPRLMRRIIASTTSPGDLVLDAFNGIGTTTLAARQLGRRFVGIELSEEYHRTALQRHKLLESGEDPFAKRLSMPSVKNNKVRRQGQEPYKVAKKTLQLAVRDLSQKLGRLPTRADVEAHLPYPIDYFDSYFKSWSEVVAAARTTGMTELPRQGKVQHAAESYKSAI